MTNLIEPRRMGVSEFAYAVSARPSLGDWSAFAVSAGLLPDVVAEDLGEQLQIFSDVAVHIVAASDDAAAIVELFETTAPGTVILKETESLSEETLRRLDFARSRLGRDGAVVLILKLDTLRRLLHVAPNLASFVEGFVAMLAPEAERLTSAEKESRLAALRVWAGLTDAEVVALASRGKLSPDPEYAEWLVLLGHGGLIGRE